MSIPSQSKHLSTYILPTSSQEEEIRHLQIQDYLLITGMGGVLPEQDDPGSLQHVLDIGCNSGRWLLETARTYPHISELVGLNISHSMAEYANRQAVEQQLNERVTFHALNGLGVLEFPNDQFDLVNIQFGQSFLRIWDWPQLLQECKRIIRPGGVLRITEMDFFKSSNSILKQQKQLVEQTLYRVGHRFAPDNEDIATEFFPLLQRNGLQHIQSRRYTLEYHKGMPEEKLIIEKITYSYRYMRTFLQKWTRLPLDYDARYHQLLEEMQQSDITITWPLLTTWCTVEPT